MPPVNMETIVTTSSCFRNLVLATFCVGTLIPMSGRSQEAAEQLFQDGDRIVFLGATFIERMQEADYLETELICRFPKRNLTFRNLGWSGDTVGGISRAVFGSPADGFARLKKDLKGTQPSVVVLCYGGNEAYSGAEGLQGFEKDTAALLDTVESLTRRIVILTPPFQERRPAPLPSPAEYNERLKLYVESLRRIGKDRGHQVIELARVVQSARQSLALSGQQAVLTENGIHFGDRGYWALAPEIAKALAGRSSSWSVAVDAKSNKVEVQAVEVSGLKVTPDRVGFTALSQRLPAAMPPQNAKGQSVPLRDTRYLKVEGLRAGKYQIHVDGKTVADTTAKQLAAGVKLAGSWEQGQVDSLRKQIVAKNKLYFHRYRPQNETYLFLFRKREQGNNAVEIPQFDPLVEAAEKEIALLKKPKAHRIDVIRQK